MGTLTIRNIDEDLKTRLRIRAAEHGQSMEAEVRDILKTALQHQAPERGLGTLIHQHFADMGGVELELSKRDSSVRIVEFPE